MGKTWKELQKEIEDYIVEIWLEEPEELSKLHQGKLENCAGSYGQYFSTIDHACGMVRDFKIICIRFLSPLWIPLLRWMRARC